MTENLILIAVSIVPWFLITFLAMVEKYYENSENPKGVSILPGLIIMPILTFAVGFTINHFFANMGTWLIGILLGAYICFGIINMIRIQNKSKA